MGKRKDHPQSSCSWLSCRLAGLCLSVLDHVLLEGLSVCSALSPQCQALLMLTAGNFTASLLSTPSKPESFHLSRFFLTLPCFSYSFNREASNPYSLDYDFI